MRIIDYLLIAALVFLVVLAVRRVIKNRNSCCGNCASCNKSCKNISSEKPKK